MKEVAAEPYRDIDFSRARRGPVIRPEPGKSKISIRLENRVIDHFRSLVETAGGGNYQTLINDALVSYIEQGSVLDAGPRRDERGAGGGQDEPHTEAAPGGAQGAQADRRSLSAGAGSSDHHAVPAEVGAVRGKGPDAAPASP
jgi:uncharacterized protein (DUF4415 family)